MPLPSPSLSNYFIKTMAKGRKINVLYVQAASVSLAVFEICKAHVRLSAFWQSKLTDKHDFRTFLNQLQVTLPNLYVIYAGDAVLVKIISLPKTSAKNTQELVDKLIKDSFLEDKNLYSSKWVELSCKLDSRKVFVAILKKAQIESLSGSLKKEAKKYKTITPHSLCVYNALKATYPDNRNNIILISLTGDKVAFAFLYGDKFWFREISLLPENDKRQTILNNLSDSIEYFRNCNSEELANKLLVNKAAFVVLGKEVELKGVSVKTPEILAFDDLECKDELPDAIIPMMGLVKHLQVNIGASLDLAAKFSATNPILNRFFTVGTVAALVSAGIVVYFYSDFQKREGATNVSQSFINNNPPASFVAEETGPQENFKPSSFVEDALKVQDHLFSLLAFLESEFAQKWDGRLSEFIFDGNVISGEGYYIKIVGSLPVKYSSGEDDSLQIFLESLRKLSFIQNVELLSRDITDRHRLNFALEIAPLSQKNPPASIHTPNNVSQVDQKIQSIDFLHKGSPSAFNNAYEHLLEKEDFRVVINRLLTKRESVQEDELDFQVGYFLIPAEKQNIHEINYSSLPPLTSFLRRKFDFENVRLKVKNLTPAPYRLRALGWFSVNNKNFSPQIILHDKESDRVALLKAGEVSDILEVTINDVSEDNQTVQLLDHRSGQSIRLKGSEPYYTSYSVELQILEDEQSAHHLKLNEPYILGSGDILTIEAVSLVDNFIALTVDDGMFKHTQNIYINE